MDQTTLFIPLGNDITVTARFPEISDGTGMISEFWIKPSKMTPDTDPAVSTYTSPIGADPDNVGATMAQFSIPSTDNDLAGALWWRVDVVDSVSHRQTANAGPYMVETV